MNPNKRLTELVTLKQLNLNTIVDLLNTPNTDPIKLHNAKDTQDYLNYQISLIKAANKEKVTFPINSPIFQQGNELSSFASFKPSTNTIHQNTKAEEWDFNARQLLPKETSLEKPLYFLQERNKEEIIFKPSQEQLSGIVRLPEDNWVQSFPKNVQVQQQIEPIQEQFIIAPIKCETNGLTNDSTITSAKFVRIPEITTEIEQAVKKDLKYLQQNLEIPRTQDNSLQVNGRENLNEDIYTDPYSEYYN